MYRRVIALAIFALVALAVTSHVEAQDGQAPERRIAFVVGNETYSDGALPTAANDAGLIAQTLQAAGFEVVGARDLDAETLRQSYVEFQRRLNEAGPGTVAFIYLAGYGLQYGRDNYFVPIGANLAADADVPISAIRLADLMAPLENLNLKARFFVFDAAYPPPFRLSGPGLPGGLGLVEATPGSLVAYNAAPGTVAPVRKGNYGVYAQALAAELRQGGQSPDEIFDHLRLRVSDESQGAVVPWDSSKVDPSFLFFERAPDAPPVAAVDTEATSRTALKTMPVRTAYSAALVRDTPKAYDEFVTAFPNDPLAKRARVLVAARREALTWQRATLTDSPAAYWTYLRRYPRSPHARMAEFRLRQLSAATAPPQDFTPIDYDVAPPSPDELRYLDRPAINFSDPYYDLPPPPRAPNDWIAPMPVGFARLPPPEDSDELFLLPSPAFVPIPAFYNPPRFVVAPRDNRFFGGPDGGRRDGRGPVLLGARGLLNDIHRAPVRGPGARVPLVALPVAVQQRATVFQSRGIRTRQELRAARQRPGGLNDVLRGPATRGQPQEQRLPGTGRPLPPGGNGAAGRNGPGLNPDDGRRGGTDVRGGPGARPGGPGGAGPGSRPGERIDGKQPGMNQRPGGAPGTGNGDRKVDTKPGDVRPGQGGKGQPGDKAGSAGRQPGGQGPKGRDPGADRVGPPGGNKPGGANRPGGPDRQDPNAGPKAGQNAGPKPGSNTGPKPGSNAGPKPGSNAGPKPGPNAGPKPGPNAGPKPGPNAGPKPGPNAGPKPGPNAGPKPGSGQREPSGRPQGAGDRGRDLGRQGGPEQRPGAGQGGPRPTDRPGGIRDPGRGPGGGGAPGGPAGGMRGGGGTPGGPGGGMRGGGAPGGGMPGGGGGMRGGGAPGGGVSGGGVSGGGGGAARGGGGGSPGGGMPAGGGRGGGPGGGR